MKTTGIKTWDLSSFEKNRSFRVQGYWPDFEIDSLSGVYYVGFDTVLRFQWTNEPSRKYRAFGFRILGFGFGIDWVRGYVR